MRPLVWITVQTSGGGAAGGGGGNGGGGGAEGGGSIGGGIGGGEQTTTSSPLSQLPAVGLFLYLQRRVLPLPDSAYQRSQS